MENYLMINGKRIDLTEEQIEILTEGCRKEDPFERRPGEIAYYINYDGKVYSDTDDEAEQDDEAYDVANYCTSKELMEQRALHEILNRRLWRYSEQHGGEAEWDGKNRHWSVAVSKENDQLDFVWVCSIKTLGEIYFRDEATARGAAREIVEPFLKEHPGFVL